MLVKYLSAMQYLEELCILMANKNIVKVKDIISALMSAAIFNF